ncbi:hypothetical protein QE152_g596 [Popillia japonica]|uniref:Uncharacterized protein n=1 Tax=Popillia japonica TaxID=7064 RepID=A0AAW1NEC6_POPJA
MNNNIDQIIQTYRTNENNSTEDITEKKLAVTANRLRRYKESQLRRKQNKDFRTDQKRFYRSLEKPPEVDEQQNKVTHNIPMSEHMRDYWKDIWETPVYHKIS